MKILIIEDEKILSDTIKQCIHKKFDTDQAYDGNIQAKQQLLLEEPDSKILDKSEDINISIKETRRLTKMIKELMILSTSDMKQIKMNKQETKIDEMIKEIAIPYIEFAKMENKTLNLEFSYNKNINIDRDKISQVIIILLDNAIKYTKENDEITIKTTYKEGKCIIEVLDTGIGISKEGLKHVFERFYREDKARSRQTGGTGLRIIDSIYFNKTSWRKY